MKADNLKNHPEGGKFKEVFRSTSRVTTDSGTNRSALTHIYFSLDPGEISHFHRVTSDEVWNLYQGSGLYLYTWEKTQARPSCHELSTRTNAFCHVVPAGVWQAAEPINETILAGCSVGPGFEFQDFELMNPASESAGILRSNAPDFSRFIMI